MKYTINAVEGLPTWRVGEVVDMLSWDESDICLVVFADGAEFEVDFKHLTVAK